MRFEPRRRQASGFSRPFQANRRFLVGVLRFLMIVRIRRRRGRIGLGRALVGVAMSVAMRFGRLSGARGQGQHGSQQQDLGQRGSFFHIARFSLLSFVDDAIPSLT